MLKAVKRFPDYPIVDSNDEVDKIITERILDIIKKYQFQIACPHTWERFGHGFKCHNCDYYTGGDRDLNLKIDPSYFKH